MGSLHRIWYKWNFKKVHCLALSLVLTKAFQFLKLKKQHLDNMVGEGGGEIDFPAGIEPVLMYMYI